MHIIFDIKHNSRFKSQVQVVASGHPTDTLINSVYVEVVVLRLRASEYTSI